MSTSNTFLGLPWIEPKEPVKMLDWDWGFDVEFESVVLEILPMPASDKVIDYRAERVARGLRRSKSRQSNQ